MSHSKASPIRVAAEDRRVKAWELRLRGLTYRQIGTELGCSEPHAYKLVMRELRRLIAKREELASDLIRLETERYDKWLAALADKVEKGDAIAVEKSLAISARRSKLLGLDAPQKREITGANGGPLRFSMEEAIAADKELEAWQRDRVRTGAGGAVDAGNPQVS
jgi:hypothetical protein